MIPKLGRGRYPIRQRPHTRYKGGLNNALLYGEVAQDYFDNRLVAAGTSLGTPLYSTPSGVWTPYNTVTGTSYQVDKGQAIITPSSAPRTLVDSLTGGPNLARPWVKALFSWDSEAVGAAQEFSVQAFGLSITGPDDDALRADLQDDPTLGLRLSVTRIVGGAANSLGSTITLDAGGYTAGDLWWLELDVDGVFGSGDMRARAYRYGQDAPAWQTSANYGSGTFPGTSGQVGLRTRCNSGNTNLSPVRVYEFHAFDNDIIAPNLGINYTDSGTVGVLISVSYSDAREISDSGTVPIAVTPSGTDIHEYTDSATVAVKVTPASTDVAGFVDAATVAVAVTPSSTDVAGFVDAATVAVKVTPAATEVAGLGDALTVPVAVTPSGTDTMAAVDSGTVGVTVTPSAVELRERTDAGTVNVTVTPATDAEFKTIVDSATVPLTVTVTGIEQSQFGDSGSVPVVVTPSGVDAFTGGEAATVPVLITPTGVDTKGGVDAQTVYVEITPHRVGADLYSTVSAGTVPITVSPVGTDAQAAADTGVVYVDISGSSTDLVAKEWVDTNTVSVKVTPATDAEIFGHTDAATVRVNITPQAAAEAINLYVVPLTITPDGTDARLFEEFQLLVVKVTPDATESDLSLSTISEVPVSIVPMASEIYDISEAATVYVDVLPALVEEIPSMTDYLLVGTLSQRWSGVLEDRPVVAVPAERQFTASIESNTYIGRYRGRGDE